MAASNPGLNTTGSLILPGLAFQLASVNALPRAPHVVYPRPVSNSGMVGGIVAGTCASFSAIVCSNRSAALFTRGALTAADRAAWRAGEWVALPRQVVSTLPVRASMTTQSPAGASLCSSPAGSVSTTQARRGTRPRAGLPA